MPHPKMQESENDLVLSFYAVRQALGLLGLGLPVLLIVYAKFSAAGLEQSISEFYYTPVGDILVGVLCAIGVFLFTYNGYHPKDGEWISDRVVSRIAGTAAIGVAIFPSGLTMAISCNNNTCPVTGFTWHPNIIHFASAGVFFGCLSLFCLVLFTRCDPLVPRSNRKNSANVFYKLCGCVILLAIAAIAIMLTILRQPLGPFSQFILTHHLVFWFESIAVWAFALSWLAKGKALTYFRRMVL